MDMKAVQDWAQRTAGDGGDQAVAEGEGGGEQEQEQVAALDCQASADQLRQMIEQIKALPADHAAVEALGDAAEKLEEVAVMFDDACVAVEEAEAEAAEEADEEAADDEGAQGTE